MHKQLLLVFALALSAFAQSDAPYQVGYAANLNIGDAEVNISNDGARAGFYNNNTTGKGAGNICANVYVFDPSEEEVACCSCLVTPNALVSLSAKNSLIADVLTPAIPTSIVIKLTGTVPGTATGGVYTACNPTLDPTVGANPPLQTGLVAWGATLEPSSPAGTFGVVNVPFLQANLAYASTGYIIPSEITDLATTCAFVQQEGTGFGVCKGCALGALSGTKQ